MKYAVIIYNERAFDRYDLLTSEQKTDHNKALISNYILVGYKSFSKQLKDLLSSFRRDYKNVRHDDTYIYYDYSYLEHSIEINTLEELNKLIAEVNCSISINTHGCISINNYDEED